MNGRPGYPGYSTNPYRHVMVDHTARPGAGAEMIAKVKAAVAEARAAEERRNAQIVAAEVARLAARVAELEHPPEVTEPGPTTPPPTATTGDTGRAPMTGADTEWLLGRWRDNGWRE